MLKVFLDTNILISSTFWKGSSYKVITKIIDGELIGFTTNEILQEYHTVLKRDFGLSEDEADIRVEKVLGILNLVHPTDKLNIIIDDPQDNKVLEGAIEAKADLIISYDRHLLTLNSFRGIPIIKPEELLDYIG